MVGFEKAVFFTKTKKLVLRYTKKLSGSCQNPIFYNEFVGSLQSKKSTFWLPFGSVWEAHVPKTIFFTMNLKDFRGVVFDSQKF